MVRALIEAYIISDSLHSFPTMCQKTMLVQYLLFVSSDLLKACEHIW